MGNTVSVVVWSVLVPTIGGARFFIALGLSDLLADIFGIVVFAKIFYDYGCNIYVLLYVFEFFNYLSAHLTAAMAMHRLLSVARPFSAQGLCSKYQQLLTIAVLVLLTAVDTVGFMIFKRKTYEICTENGSGLDDLVQMSKAMTIHLSSLQCSAHCCAHCLQLRSDLENNKHAGKNEMVTCVFVCV